VSVDALLDRATASIPRTLGFCILLMLPMLALAVWGFRLSGFGAGALYFVVWWTVLFAVLPFRAAPDGTEVVVPGQDLGAPHKPQMRRKAVWTTLVSDVVFILAVAAFPLAGL
jgi:predicted secreted protein